MASRQNGPSRASAASSGRVSRTSQITSTVTGVRRSGVLGEDGVERRVERTRVVRSSSAKPGFQEEVHESSFIQDSSFVQNPLNSRIVPRTKSTHETEEPATKSLKGVPVDIQEALILEDLLSVLMGISGQHIAVIQTTNELSKLGSKIVVNEHLDASLKDLVRRVLPLATYYTAIVEFIELRSNTRYGLVNHALCGSMRDMLKDYLTLIAQLEHSFISSSTFSLQKLWYYVQPSLYSLSLLYNLITELLEIEEADKVDESSDESELDPEEEAERRALGLGDVKAVMSGLLESKGPVKGGEIVSILWEKLRNNGGDPRAQKLYQIMLQRSSVPYSQMVRRWTTTGILDDPYDEIMVKEAKSINKGNLKGDFIDEYWEKRYTLRDGSNNTMTGRGQTTGVPPVRQSTAKQPGGACIPQMLEGWKHKILLAGKYFNVLRECGEGVDAADETPWLLDEESFFARIEDAYTFANRSLLKLLIDDQQLVPRLRAIKNYFFLRQSAYLTHFLELAAPELRKSSRSVSLPKLQSLLELALNMNFSGDDVAFKYREDVSIVLDPRGSTVFDILLKITSTVGAKGEGLEGGLGDLDLAATVATQDTDRKAKEEKEKEKRVSTIEVVGLDFHVPFPLSLVLSRNALLRYQWLFRFLLCLKNVEQSLLQMWIDQKSRQWRSPAPWYEDFERWRRRVMSLRTRMLALVQQIIAYVTLDVVEPNWAALESKLSKVTTVDQLLRDHVHFLDTCLKECMLTKERALKIQRHLLTTCHTFAQYTNAFNRTTNQIADQYAETGEVDPNDPNLGSDRRWSFLQKFERNFDHFSKNHLDVVQLIASGETNSLLALLTRLTNAKFD